MSENSNIPARSRPEWRDIVTGKIDHTFDNFVLRMKTFKFSNQLKSGALTEDQAIDELYELATKYSRSVQRDFKTIFKQW